MSAHCTCQRRPPRRQEWTDSINLMNTATPGGLVGYTATKKDQHLVDWAENLDDISFDGQPLDSQQQQPVAGLGQLTDGIVTDNRTSPNGTFFGKCLLFVFQNRNN